MKKRERERERDRERGREERVRGREETESRVRETGKSERESERERGESETERESESKSESEKLIQKKEDVAGPRLGADVDEKRKVGYEAPQEKETITPPRKTARQRETENDARRAKLIRTTSTSTTSIS